MKKVKKSLEKTKGITLVALVVTIVVLLILAGITVTMLFGENGIIKKAQEAKEETEKTTTEEQEGINALGDRINSILNLEGNNENEEVPDILERYILGENKTGILATNILNPSTYKFIDNDIIPDASTSITFGNMNYNTENIYVMFLYDNEPYIAVGDYATYQTKEVRRAKETKIYEGTIELTSGEPIELINLKESITRTNLYMLNLTVDGEERNVSLRVGGGFFGGPDLVGFISNETDIVVLTEALICWFYPSDTINTVILNSIYDFGAANNANYVEENGFGAYYDNGKWLLCYTPNTSYEIPTSVSGYKIDEVMVDLISGEPIFTEPVTLNCWDMSYFMSVSYIKVTTPNIDFILGNDWFWNSSNLYELDLSECGDDITIPTDFITNHSWVTIYVNSAVKANYEGYSNVVAK